jgi:hypothetical protein
LGIPSLASVKTAIRSKTYGPFERLVWQYIDNYQFGQVSSKDSDRMIRDAYDEAREHLMAGGSLPDEPAALIEVQEVEAKPSDPEFVKKQMQDIAQELGIK